ncbi:MAG: ankyrin repeat domain-containing protein [Saprospiraceae bacterium]|nr:ankyrin repeat domain-containing protein [Saprospiraceae bacterium]
MCIGKYKNGLFPIIAFILFLSISLHAQVNELSDAISKGHFKKSKELCTTSRWLNIVSGQLNWTPIYFAIFQAGIDSSAYIKLHKKYKENLLPTYRGHKESFLEMCKTLIDSGIKLNSFDKKGRSPLYYAALFRLDTLVDYFIANGATIEDSDDLFRIAASFGYPNICKQLLKYKLDPCATGKECFAPIHLAAINGHTQVLKTILESKINVDCLTREGYASFSGLTALQLAAMNGQAEIVALLIQSEAKTNVTNSQKENILHFAAKGPRQDVYKLDKKGEPEDYIYVKGSDLKTAMIVDSFVPELGIHDQIGANPLHWAAYFRNLELCTYFISKKQYPVVVQNDAAHCFATALNHTMHWIDPHIELKVQETEKIINYWEIAETKYRYSLQKINNKLLGKKLLQIGTIALAVAAASYQASIDAASSGFGYSSINYPIIESGDLPSIKKHIHRQITICQNFRNFLKIKNSIPEQKGIHEEIKNLLNHE